MVGFSDERIDGWKSIAAYLKRDRSTVIRWTNERGLPVHSLPGGKRRTVFAIRSELDTWTREGGPDLEPPEPTEQLSPVGIEAITEQPIASGSVEPVMAPTASAFSAPLTAAPDRHGAQRRRLLLQVAAAAGAALLVVSCFLALHSRRAAPALDPVTRAQLLRAADQVASRSSVELAAALPSLRAIAGRHPDNAEAQAALAEAYLLAREFGSLPDTYALTAAKQVATKARRLDPTSGKALRVLGLIAYWRDHDPRAAGKTFRQAIAANRSDPLTHQWYANILADNGEDTAAMREFQAARELNPGAAYLLADYAWGLWCAGRQREGEALLTELARTQPAMASIYDGLSVMVFARGDLQGYARQLRRRALFRQAPELLAHSRLIDRVVASSSGRRQVYDAMLSRALALGEATPQADHSWAAFVASAFGDRSELISILRASKAHGERWGAAGFTRRIALRWKEDEAVQAGLAALRQPLIEPHP